MKDTKTTHALHSQGYMFLLSTVYININVTGVDFFLTLLAIMLSARNYLLDRLHNSHYVYNLSPYSNDIIFS